VIQFRKSSVDCLLATIMIYSSIIAHFVPCEAKLLPSSPRCRHDWQGPYPVRCSLPFYISNFSLQCFSDVSWHATQLGPPRYPIPYSAGKFCPSAFMLDLSPDDATMQEQNSALIRLDTAYTLCADGSVHLGQYNWQDVYEIGIFVTAEMTAVKSKIDMVQMTCSYSMGA
jgi:hypothetical protein